MAEINVPCCDVCTFRKRSIILNCVHALCHPCVENCALAAKKQEIACPFCRAPYRLESAWWQTLKVHIDREAAEAAIAIARAAESPLAPPQRYVRRNLRRHRSRSRSRERHGRHRRVRSASRSRERSRRYRRVRRRRRSSSRSSSPRYRRRRRHVA